jgi:hypothetical protein
MTDRLKGVLVTFDGDIRDDDAEALVNAIRCMRRVSDVSPILTDYEDHMARARVRDELWQKVRDAFFPPKT